MSFNTRAERALRGWALVCARRPKSVICTVAVLTLLALEGLDDLEIRTSTESLLKNSDPARAAMTEFRREFGNDDVLLFLLRSEDLFAPEFVAQLGRLHDDLERNLPFADEVTSLLNARFVYGVDDTLVVEDLMADWPPEPAELREIERRARVNPLYRNSIISEDGRHTAVIVELAAEVEAQDLPGMSEGRALTNEEAERLVTSAAAIIERHQDENFPVWTAGRQPATIGILRVLRTDMPKFTALSTMLIGLLLFALFRRVSGVLLPLATVALALVTTFGVMGLVGVAITPATQVLPSFLIAVGVADAVHLLTVFYQQLDLGYSHRDALANSIEHTGIAIVMTSLTTAACLGSFMFADLAVLTGFGFFSALGVMLALGYTLCLLPPLLAILPIGVPLQASTSQPRPKLTERILGWVGRTATGYPRSVVLSWTLLVSCALIAAVHLRLEHKPVEWLPQQHPTRVAAEKVGETMRASISYEIVIDSREDEGLYEPEAMRRLDAMGKLIENTTVSGLRAGRAISLVDIVKETHQALNGNAPQFFTVPDNRQLIAQELLLFEMSGSDDTDELTDKAYRRARMTVPVPISGGFVHKAYIAHVGNALNEIAAGALDVTVTGQAYLDGRAGTAMMSSMVKSYLIALALLTPLMLLLTRDVKLGLISIVPNLAPIVIALGLMYWLDFTLDMFTLLIGSLAIGIAVDDTIHILYNVKRYHERLGSISQAIYFTLISTGRALLFTSIALATGFLVFLAGTMIPVGHFGIITAGAIITAFLADATLSPALIALLMRRRKHKRLGLSGADARSVAVGHG